MALYSVVKPNKILQIEFGLCLSVSTHEYDVYRHPNCTVGASIDGLQSIPRESNDKDVAAMLDELTIEANEESFVIVLQHGGNDVT